MKAQRTHLLRGQKKGNTLFMDKVSELGRIPGKNMLGQDVMSDALRGFAALRTYFYDLRRIRLPMTQAEFDSVFSRQFSIFTCDEDEDSCDRITNTSCGSSINSLFVATGIGIVAIGEGAHFSVHGMQFPAQAQGSNTPRVAVGTGGVTGCEDFCGSADLASSTAGGRFSQLGFGWPTQRIIEKFFQAFRFELTVNRRLKYVDEGLLDIGLTPEPPQFVGASCSKIVVDPFVRGVNEVMRDKAIDVTFLTINAAINSSGTVCAPSPLAPVTYGHVDIQGLANRVYPFATPLLFAPGMTFEMAFVPVLDDACFEALQSVAMASCETQDERLSATVDGVAGSCGAKCFVPGGTLTLGAVLTGFELWPAACVQFVQRFLYEGSIQYQALIESISTMSGPMLAGLLREDAKLHGSEGKLSGIVQKLESSGQIASGTVAGILGK